MDEELDMDEDLDMDDGVAELLVQKTEENQTRKILEILNDCRDLEEAIGKVKDLLRK